MIPIHSTTVNKMSSTERLAQGGSFDGSPLGGQACEKKNSKHVLGTHPPPLNPKFFCSQGQILLQYIFLDCKTTVYYTA